MNNQVKGKEDILRNYMKGVYSEKAPDGFTENLMTRIMVEKIPSLPAESWLRRNIILLASVAVTLVFIVAAFFLGGGESTNPVTDFISSLKITLPSVDLPAINKLTIPAWLPYIFLSILLLAFFDRALFRLFHSEKKKQES
jgi:MFS superfamily sulfate permease-like transporter